MSAMRPSMMALVSTTTCVWLLWVPPEAGRAPRTSPAAWAAATRSSRLATVRPTIPSPKQMDTPIGR